MTGEQMWRAFAAARGVEGARYDVWAFGGDPDGLARLALDGGKTATSQTLPRGTNKYISSFIGFAPADDPQVLAMAIIHNPQGIYYGGTIAAPVVQDIFSNIRPYLGIEKEEIITEIPSEDR